MSVLLVDGDNLLTIGFYGVKNYFYKGEHIGGIYHFLNTLRRSFENYRLDKIVVFWDGEDGSQSRRKIYHKYKKENRRIRSIKKKNHMQTKTKSKAMLGRIVCGTRRFEFCETDDCILYYQNTDENCIVYYPDGDLNQLVSENVRVYNLSQKTLRGK